MRVRPHGIGTGHNGEPGAGRGRTQWAYEDHPPLLLRLRVCPNTELEDEGRVPSHRRQPKVLALVLSDKGSLQFMVIVPLFSSEIKSIESNCGYKLAKQWDDELQDDKFVISFCFVSPT